MQQGRSEEINNMFNLIQVENLSKLRDNTDDWLVKDISFSVKPGEILGVLGKTTAERSILLQILARLREPTSGRAIVRGRIAPLFDLGVAIQRHLTGRDNIYITASLQGFNMRDVRSRVKNIVSFAKLEKLIDIPVNYYPKDKFLLFNLSLAIHLPANILLIDRFIDQAEESDNAYLIDILLDYSQSLVRSGGSVLLVSDNLSTIKKLCSTCLWLEQGQVFDYGIAKEVIAHHEKTIFKSAFKSAGQSANNTDILENEHGKLMEIKVTSINTEASGSINFTEDIFVQIQFELFLKLKVICKFDIFAENVHVFRTVINHHLVQEYSPGIYEATARIPGHLLAENNYSVDVLIKLYNLDTQETQTLSYNHAVEFQVNDTEEAILRRGIYKRKIPWLINPLLEWQLSKF